MERREYERLLDNLASANVPVEQTKEKLMLEAGKKLVFEKEK